MQHVVGEKWKQFIGNLADSTVPIGDVKRFVRFVPKAVRDIPH